MYNKGWKRIEGHPTYEINRMGEVRNSVTGKILKPYDDGSGYLRVHLNRKSLRLHILVAKTFIPNPNGYSEVNHKRGNKHDCRASQLEWVSHSENIAHMWRTGLRKRR